MNFLPDPLVLSALLNLATSAQEVKIFYDRVLSYMISKGFIEGVINGLALGVS